MMGADKKRRVTLHVQDGEGPDGSTYELQNAQLTTLTLVDTAAIAAAVRR